LGRTEGAEVGGAGGTGDRGDGGLDVVGSGTGGATVDVVGSRTGVVDVFGDRTGEDMGNVGDVEIVVGPAAAESFLSKIPDTVAPMAAPTSNTPKLRISRDSRAFDLAMSAATMNISTPAPKSDAAIQFCLTSPETALAMATKSPIKTVRISNGFRNILMYRQALF
jgi:hypothetical protein